MPKPLRFAPLIRVSTERQERKGESLNTQKSQIIQYVQTLGGTIPERCWKYSGQEHSSPGFERKKFDQLLEDSAKNLFDAVIVTHPDRWSRDSLEAKKGFKILRQNSIKFYVAIDEIDLFDEADKLKIALFNEFAEYQAMTGTRRSIENKIELAKKNIPSSGRKPFGRIYNKATGKWSLDKEKVAKIRDAAKRFIDGEKRENIAKRIGMSGPTLWRILNHSSGPSYKISFCKKELNIDETVILKIPRLLPDSTIKKIKEKTLRNKTTEHGQPPKHKYLLGRMIRCGYCGKSISGGTSGKNQIRYYIHNTNNKPEGCPFSGTPRADELETDVFTHIVWMLGDTTGLKKAIDAVTPDKTKINEAHKRLSQTTFELKKIDTKKQRLVQAVMNATLDGETVKNQMDKLLEREDLLKEDQQSLQEKIDSQPTKEDIENQSKFWEGWLRIKHTKLSDRPLEMSFEEQRELLQTLFAPKGDKRFGVFVKRKDRNHPWTYEIRGNLPVDMPYGTVGTLPPFIGGDPELDPEYEREPYEKVRKEFYKQNFVNPDN